MAARHVSLPWSRHRHGPQLMACTLVSCGAQVRFNLTLGLPYEATDSQIRRACEQARIWDFIQTLDNGVDTELGLKGLNLSGGQRQVRHAELTPPSVLSLTRA
jgi:hypothetical protein